MTAAEIEVGKDYLVFRRHGTTRVRVVRKVTEKTVEVFFHTEVSMGNGRPPRPERVLVKNFYQPLPLPQVGELRGLNLPTRDGFLATACHVVAHAGGDDWIVDECHGQKGIKVSLFQLG